MEVLNLLAIAALWAVVLLPPVLKRRQRARVANDPAYAAELARLEQDLVEHPVFGATYTTTKPNERKEVAAELACVPESWPALERVLAEEPTWARKWWALSPTERRVATMGFNPSGGLPVTRTWRTRRMLREAFGRTES